MTQSMFNWAVLVVLATSSMSKAQSMTCGGFETCATTDDWITQYGEWGVDASDVVAATLGITPPEGQQMLQFTCTSPAGSACHSPAIGGDVHQMIDISSIADLVAAGEAKLRVEAKFNRVAGDVQTDTLFRLRLTSLSGLPEGFENAPVLAFTNEDLFSDDDPRTWERVVVCHDLPAETDYVAVLVSAAEDVFNDSTAPSFDGHFVDEVILTLLPSCAGDTNADNTVDVVDLLGLLSAWGSNDPAYDITPQCVADGVVDIQDLLSLLGNWGPCS